MSVRPASEVDIQAAICFYGDRRVQKALHNSDDNQRRVDAELAYIMGLFEARYAEVRAATLKEAKQAVWDLPSGTFTNTVLRGEALEALDAIEALATRSTEEPAPEEKD